MFYEKRRLGRKTLPRGDSRAEDTRQPVGHLGSCCNGDGHNWDLESGGTGGEEQGCPGQRRTRGHGDLGFFQGFLMNAVRKMEKIAFSSLICGAQGIEYMLQKGRAIWNTPDTK